MWEVGLDIAILIEDLVEDIFLDSQVKYRIPEVAAVRLATLRLNG